MHTGARGARAMNPGAMDTGAAQRPGAAADRGAVTAEFAVALPAIVLVLAAGLTGIAAGVTQLRLEEAARAAAREVMRADNSAAQAAASRLAGPSAQLVLSAEGPWITVEVRSPLSFPLLGRLPLELSADAVAFPGDGGLPDGVSR